MLTVYGMIEQEWWGWAVDYNDKPSYRFAGHPAIFKTLSIEDAEVLFHSYKMTFKKHENITLKDYYGV